MASLSWNWRRSVEYRRRGGRGAVYSNGYILVNSPVVLFTMLATGSGRIFVLPA
ncbi:hypothetical protein F2Q70_00012870 [Brassica cretica]|uniref:Uncharacterized protein n=1 Tax=Brassica cretica TaxID=69181 RepID=A0A8S9M5U8_BRACR|nr:hypothetical protein F2Q70_00012870 [Brassica cretica]KAF3546759.1 hypothetical protein DY000_02009169 [Brassica cretica]